MKFPNHPEFTLMLDAVLKALKKLDTAEPEKIEEFKQVLSKRNNQLEYYNELMKFSTK